MTSMHIPPPAIPISGPVFTDSASGAAQAWNTANLSPEDLIAYCGAQLNSIDGQIKDFMDAQQRALQERQAIGKAVNVLKGYGDKGPPDSAAMNKCYSAIDDAIKSLPAGDPAIASLEKYKSDLQHKFGSSELTGTEKARVAELDAAGPSYVGFPLHDVNAEEKAAILNGAATRYTAPQPGEWSGFTGQLSQIGDDIKGQAELDMIKLQGLVTQRQSVVQMTTQMMAKMQESIMTIAKNV